MRPTLRCVLVFAAGFPASLLAVLVSQRLWTLWLAYLGFAALITGIDALLALPRRRLAIATDAPEMLYIGETDPFRIALSAKRWRRRAAVEVLCDFGRDLEPQPSQRTVVKPGAGARVEVALVPHRRGTVSVERVSVRWTGPFGLLARQRVENVDRKVAVVPNVRAVRAAALRFFSSREFLHGLKVEHYIGDGSEFESLREYMPGFDHRAINWKASARHRKLLCQEFRAERNHQVILAIDSGHLMSEPMAGIPKLDHAVNAGLLLAYFCLRTGDRVGLFGFDETVRCYSEPVGGLASFPRVQHLSAGLSYNQAESNFTVALADLSTRLRRRSLVILLTDFVDTITAELMIDNVYRLSRRHLVVFVTLRDPSLEERASAAPVSTTRLHESVVAGDFVREREIVIQRLKQLGVYCIDVPPAQISMHLLNRYLEIKRRELI